MPKEYKNNAEYFSKQDREKAFNKARSFYAFVKSASVASPERPDRIKELIQLSDLGLESALIINWICPPGTDLQFDQTSGKLFRRYTTINPEVGFKKDYRLLPRLSLESRLVKMIGRTTSNIEYLKIVADDNPFCLYPACLRLDTKKETVEKIQNYTDYVQEQLNLYLDSNSISVVTLSSLLGRNEFSELTDTFNKTTFDQLLPYLPKDALETEIDVLKKHTVASKEIEQKLENFAKDVIRQYAVEGYYLHKMFDDNVILAWNESTRTAKFVDSMRIANGLPALPKIFVLHEKKGAEIINNF